MIHLRTCIGLLVWLTGIQLVTAQKPGNSDYFPPRAPLPRHLEDYSGLDSLPRNTFYQNLKYLPAGRSSYFSFGGDMRLRYEKFNHYRLGLQEQDANGYLIQRYMLHADFHWRGWLRFFSQLSYTDVAWRSPGPRPVDRDRLAMHQLFVDLTYQLTQSTLSLRAGRSEHSYGNNRWLSYREGPNTRLSFDGVNLSYLSDFVMEVFYMAPVSLGPGSLDNKTDWNRKLMGFHFNSKQWIPGNEINFYGFYFQALAFLPLMNHSEQKYALGLRDKISLEHVQLDGELMWQLASPGDTTTSALLLGLDISFRPFQEYGRLHAGMEMLYTSGYRGSRSMTYQSLFPTNKNSRNADLFGKYNLSYLEPFLWWSPSDKNKFTLEINIYWRSSRQDNVYTIPGFVLYPADAFEGSYLGTQYNLLYTRSWNPFLTTELQYTRFQSSQGLRSTGARHMDLFAMMLTLKF